MSTLYFVPQLPVSGRYTFWWYPEFIKQFKRYFDDVVVLGSDFIEDVSSDRDSFESFSNTDQSILLELSQIEDYLNINDNPNDILFCSDISFPGMFSNVLYTKKFSGKKFIFCHATAKNKFDYFSDVRSSKYKVECGLSMIFDKVYVGSEYHKNKLKWNNIEVIRLPQPPNYIISYQSVSKVNEIISVSRPTPQKVQLGLEKKIEGIVGTKIIRETHSNPHKYSEFLSKSKILFISSLEDTFNYTILDAIKCDCVPVAPNTLCFNEILPKEYLYNDYIEASRICKKILRGDLQTPKILCHDEVENFFPNLINSMNNTENNMMKL